MFPSMAFWLRLLLALLLSLIVSCAVTPGAKVFACRVGAMDIPDSYRRVHDHPVPRMGGLAIFVGFLAGVLPFSPITEQVQGILLGCLIIVFTGAADDLLNLRAWQKLLAQLLAAGVAVFHGVTIQILTNPNVFSAESIVLGALSVPFTILWIVGVTNAVNLIDGLDGLAAGVSIISCATMLVVAILVADAPEVSVMLAALGGACVGFLPYNVNPAKIFMGDTGALLLGYVLSTVSILGLFKMYAVVTFAVPLLALALPLSDTLFAVVRRLLHGQPVMQPDRGHLHHLLLDLGFSQKQAVAVLYGVSAILGLAAVVLAASGLVRLLLLALAFVIAAIVWFSVFRHRRATRRQNPLPPTKTDTPPEL